MSAPANRIALLVFGYIHVEQKIIKLSGNVPDEIIYVIYDFYPVKRKHISLSVVGHHSSGKSTLSGRLLYDLKIVSNDELQKLKTLSKRIIKIFLILHILWIDRKLKDLEALPLPALPKDLPANYFSSHSLMFQDRN
eukprot:546052_1